MSSQNFVFFSEIHLFSEKSGIFRILKNFFGFMCTSETILIDSVKEHPLTHLTKHVLIDKTDPGGVSTLQTACQLIEMPVKLAVSHIDAPQATQA